MEDGPILVLAENVSKETRKWAHENKIEIVKFTEPFQFGYYNVQLYGFGHEHVQEHTEIPVTFMPILDDDLPQQFLVTLSQNGKNLLELEVISDGYTIVKAPYNLF